ncbi:MAG: 4a-hydroxytetrahydrobiopterin dehydratase [Isosphaeraceae bacterium]
METQPTTLLLKKCVPCERGVPKLSADECVPLLKETPGWQLDEQALKISRSWVPQDFMEAIRFFDSVAALAEEEGHHPDLHLTGYRQVKIEIMTHAIGGLSENDFILAAKINQIPIKEKRRKPG